MIVKQTEGSRPNGTCPTNRTAQFSNMPCLGPDICPAGAIVTQIEKEVARGKLTRAEADESIKNYLNRGTWRQYCRRYAPQAATI